MVIFTFSSKVLLSNCQFYSSSFSFAIILLIYLLQFLSYKILRFIVFIHLGLPFETKVGTVRLRIVVGDISLQTVSFIHLLECYFTEHYLVDLQMP